jgi:hypothetical protein
VGIQAVRVVQCTFTLTSILSLKGEEAL